MIGYCVCQVAFYLYKGPNRGRQGIARYWTMDKSKAEKTVDEAPPDKERWIETYEDNKIPSHIRENFERALREEAAKVVA